jgi:hypothetical protein
MMFQYSTFLEARPLLTNVTTLVSSRVIMWLPFGVVNRITECHPDLDRGTITGDALGDTGPLD